MPRPTFDNSGLNALSKFAYKDQEGSNGYPGRFDEWEAKHGKGAYQKEAMMLNTKKASESKVEDFKIDPGLKKVAKQYKKLTKTSAAMKKDFAVKQSALQQMARVIFGTDQIRDKILSLMNPKEKVPDQPEASPDLEIKY